MNLPLVVDIAIGLIFIYLTLSLLASEIQELMTTLLQWRAEHLKRSIEVLLAGGTENSKTREIQKFANNIYSHPLVNNLNQEAKGLFATALRKIAQFAGTIYRKLTGSDNTFGDRTSGPSYIPPETFATTLIETLKLPEMAQTIATGRLEKFKQKRLQEIQAIALDARLDPSARGIVDRETQFLGQHWDEIVADFSDRKTSLAIGLDRFNEKYDIYIRHCQNDFPQRDRSCDYFVRRVVDAKENTFNEIERKVLLSKLKPSLNEVADILRKNYRMYNELEDAVKDKDSPTYQGIQQAIDELPDSVKDSLAVIANRISSEGESIEDELQQLQSEIETWFDRSMTRASGVYKRNARGIAILIGIAVAVLANADTLNIVENLSSNSALRAAITDNAGQIVAEDRPGDRDLNRLKDEMRDTLRDVSLPIGWKVEIVEQQNLADRNIAVPYVRRIIGWFISGLAISMGASFWFDLLGKIVDIRNTGKKG